MCGLVLRIKFHHITVVSRKYTPPFATLALVQSVGGGGWGERAYAWDKNTSARLCAKMQEGLMHEGGAYLRDTMVHVSKVTGIQ